MVQTGSPIILIEDVLGEQDFIQNARVNLKIYEPEGSQRPARTERPERSESAGIDTSSVDDLKI